MTQFNLCDFMRIFCCLILPCANSLRRRSRLLVRATSTKNPERRRRRQCRLNIKPAPTLPFESWQRKPVAARRSEEHTSELQSLMRISYAVFCLKKKKKYRKESKNKNKKFEQQRKTEERIEITQNR